MLIAKAKVSSAAILRGMHRIPSELRSSSLGRFAIGDIIEKRDPLLLLLFIYLFIFCAFHLADHWGRACWSWRSFWKLLVPIRLRICSAVRPVSLQLKVSWFLSDCFC